MCCLLWLQMHIFEEFTQFCQFGVAFTIHFDLCELWVECDVSVRLYSLEFHTYLSKVATLGLLQSFVKWDNLNAEFRFFTFDLVSVDEQEERIILKISMYIFLFWNTIRIQKKNWRKCTLESHEKCSHEWEESGMFTLGRKKNTLLITWMRCDYYFMREVWGGWRNFSKYNPHLVEVRCHFSIFFILFM